MHDEHTQLDMLTPTPEQKAIWQKDEVILAPEIAIRGLRSFGAVEGRVKRNLFQPTLDDSTDNCDDPHHTSRRMVVDEHGSTRINQFINHRFFEAAQQIPETEYPIIEIFKSIEGEGLHLGTPRILVRASGCAVGCDWCDTPHSWAFKHSKTLPLEVVAESIIKMASGSAKEISFTGGEPMHYPRQLLSLGRRLKQEGFRLNLETSGTIFHEQVFDLFDFISMDIKTPSSGVILSAGNLEMLRRTYDNYEHAQFKAVILDGQDLEWVDRNLSHWYAPHAKNRRPLILTPGVVNTKKAIASNELGAKLADTIDMILAWNQGYNIRAVPQVHALLQFR